MATKPMECLFQGNILPTKKKHMYKNAVNCVDFFPNCFHEPDGQRSIAEKHHTAYLETNHAPTGNDLQKRPD